MITISPQVVAFVTGPTLVPIIVGLATKAGISLKIKTAIVALVSLLVAALASFVVPDTGAAVVSWEALSNFFIVFITAGAGYDKFWRPILALNERLIPNKGIGTPVPPEVIAHKEVVSGTLVDPPKAGE